MSLINKMLQELDRRHASGDAGPSAPPKQVRTVVRRAVRSEWFWRTLAALIVVALGWVGWVAYQMWPRPLATDLAYKAADQARARPPASQPAPPAAPPAPVAVAPAPPPQVAPPAPQPENLRLAESIETPIIEPATKPATQPAAPAVPKAASAKELSKVERRDRIGSPAERAENEFRYAAGVLKLGRSAEAESRFAKALEFDSRHRGARQALVAMHLERGQLEAARRLLQESLQLEPAQPDFAITLARILVERKDLPGALAALEGASSAAANSSEYHATRGTILQRLGRHADASDAYQTALQLESTMPQAWIGLGISLEAQNKRPEAADAFRRALAAGPTSAEVKAFAEQRIRALR